MLFRDLKKTLNEKVENIYLIYGDDAFLRETSLRLIKEKALLEPDLNLTNLTGQEVKQDYETLYSSTQSYPFMSDKRYVVVRDFNPTASDLKNKVLKRVLDELPETTVFIIVNEKNAEQLAKKEGVTLVDCNKDKTVISDWVIKTCKKQGVIIAPSTVSVLASFCSNDMARISCETEKLIAYVGKNAEITKETVELLVGKETEYQVYKLADFISQSNYEASFEILFDLVNKNQDKYYLFSTIYYHYRTLLHASLSRMSASELSSHLNVHKFVAEKAITQSKRFKPKRLKAICDKLGSYDGAIKSGELLVDTALWNSVLNAMLME
ncbi:MAG: DNA polymerase III subunit delta [Clostridia bacterium]|nr:DNA polymerase III subunit delta [Clostridia bacterium]